MPRLRTDSAIAKSKRNETLKEEMRKLAAKRLQGDIKSGMSFFYQSYCSYPLPSATSNKERVAKAAKERREK